MVREGIQLGFGQCWKSPEYILEERLTFHVCGFPELPAQADDFIDLIFRKRFLDDDCILLARPLAL